MTFYCLVKNDGTDTEYSRTAFLLETFLTLVFASLTEIVLGLINLRLECFMYYILIMLPSPFLAYIIVNKKFKDDMGMQVVKTFSDYDRKRRVWSAILAIVLFITAFILVIFSGMFMSYMFNLYESNQH